MSALLPSSYSPDAGQPNERVDSAPSSAGDTTPSGALHPGMGLLHTMLENISDLIYVMDVEGRLRYISPSVERILGYTPAEMVGHLANDFLHPADRPFADRAFEDSIQRPDSTRRMELRIRHRDGSWPVFEVFGRIVKDEDGAMIAVVTSHDVTERKRLEQQRAQVLQFVGHDLRTPLTSILLHVDLLGTWLGEQGRNGPGGDSLRAILSSAEQMESLIRDVTDAGRVEAGGLSLVRGPLSSEALLRDALTVLQPLARERSIRLELDPSPNVWIRADRERLLQVISNLVANALRFTPEGGRISLRVEVRSDEILFSVSDTGCGVEEADLPQVFDRYWQAKPDGGGTSGLGLAIVKGIVEAHGGRIWAESEVGAGSTFHFAIPREPDLTDRG